jgi:hypothetical protein
MCLYVYELFTLDFNSFSFSIEYLNLAGGFRVGKRGATFTPADVEPEYRHLI